MIGLVVMAGGLALVSGALKIFGRGRRPGQFPLLGLLELVAGVVVPLFAAVNRPSSGILAVLLFGTLGLALLSSGIQVTQARGRRRHREVTESARLVTYVRYLSHPPEEAGSPRDKV